LLGALKIFEGLLVGMIAALCYPKRSVPWKTLLTFEKISFIIATSAFILRKGMVSEKGRRYLATMLRVEGR